MGTGGRPVGALRPADVAARAFSVILVMALGSSVAAQSEPEPWKVRWEALEKQLAICTDRHGYDPQSAQGLAPHALGEGELEWRECAYQAVRETLAANSPIEYAYRRLIAEDKRITKAVAAGEISRSEREQRIRTYLAQIQEKEDKELEMRKLERQRDAFLGRMNELRRMRELERRLR